MALTDNFRDNLDAKLKALGWSQNDLADASGVHFVTISRILNRHMEPSLEICEKLAKAVGLRPEKIFQKIA